VAGAQAIQTIVTVLLVATSAAVFVVAIGVFVALTLPKFGRVSGRRTINRVLMQRRRTCSTSRSASKMATRSSPS
jgi:hypothetical protein